MVKKKNKIFPYPVWGLIFSITGIIGASSECMALFIMYGIQGTLPKDISYLIGLLGCALLLIGGIFIYLRKDSGKSMTALGAIIISLSGAILLFFSPIDGSINFVLGLVLFILSRKVEI